MNLAKDHSTRSMPMAFTILMSSELIGYLITLVACQAFVLHVEKALGSSRL